jgi:hypothetical protein
LHPEPSTLNLKTLNMKLKTYNISNLKPQTLNSIEITSKGLQFRGMDYAVRV